MASAAYGALDARRDESEPMVAALVDMEASYFDADFFREVHPRGASSEVYQPRPSRPPCAPSLHDSGRWTKRRPTLVVDDDGRRRRRRRERESNPRWARGPVPASHRLGRQGRSHSSVRVRVRGRAPRTRIAKSVPLAAVHCQVVPARVGLLADFYANLGGKTREELASLMAEDDGVGERREACKTRLGLLNRARAEIAAVVG